jgi:hypothetical protein
MADANKALPLVAVSLIGLFAARMCREMVTIREGRRRPDQHLSATSRRTPWHKTCSPT